MAKVLTRLMLAAACCAGVGPALAQPQRGAVAAPAPHVSAPAAPHVAPAVPHVAVPHVSAPAPHIAAAPRFNAAPRINAAPRVATPRFSARTPNVRQFTPRGHAFTTRNFPRQAVHGPAASRLGRFAGRPVTRGASRNFPGRNLARHQAGSTRGAERGRARSAAGTLARTNERINRRANQANRRVVTGRNPGANARNSANAGNAANTRNETMNGRSRLGAANRNRRVTGPEFATLSRPLGARNRDFKDRHRFFEHRRRFGLGGFVGWFGPVFWPLRL